MLCANLNTMRGRERPEGERETSGGAVERDGVSTGTRTDYIAPDHSANSLLSPSPFSIYLVLGAYGTPTTDLPFPRGLIFCHPLSSALTSSLLPLLANPFCYPSSCYSVHLLPSVYNHRFAFLSPLAEGIPVFE